MTAGSHSSRPKRPQLTPEELQQMKWLMGTVLTLIGISTVLYMEVEAWTLMALTAAAALATAWNPRLPARVPAVVHTLAFPAIVIFFAADMWLLNEVLPAMVRLDLLLLLYRSISYRQRRDDLQIIVLGLFLIVIAGVLTVSLTFATQLLFYAAAALAFLLIITLTDTATGQAQKLLSRPPPGEVPAWAQHANWPQLFRRVRQVLDWKVLSLGAALFVGVVAVTALLFLSIPRFQFANSMFLDRFISKKARSGFSETIRFGDVTEIQQDTSVALSVDVTDQGQVPATPYWRMLVLDHYRDGMFRMSPSLKREAFTVERTADRVVGERPQRGAAVYWTYYLESGISRFLPLLGTYDEMQFREPQNYIAAPDLALVSLRTEPVSMLAYRVQGAELGGALKDPRFGERWRARHTRVPAMRGTLYHVGATSDVDRAVLARVLGLIRGDATAGPSPEWNARDFTRLASAWLQTQHGYSLAPRIPAGEGDPLVRWLASRAEGHCELFAGSFVLLARAAGFPARVVTGFRGGTWNAYSNNFTIRNSDAHAWAEIFDETSDTWLRADPLAPATDAGATEVRGEAAVAQRLDRSWAARLDSLRVFWYRRIVNFDERSQVETLKAVKEATQASGRELRAAIQRAGSAVKAWFTSPWDAARISQVVGSVAFVAALILLWRRFGRGWWRDFSRVGSRQQDPTRREAGHWLRLLGAYEPGGADEAQRVREDLERIRFGPRQTWPRPEPVFRRARQALRAARRDQRVSRR